MAIDLCSLVWKKLTKEKLNINDVIEFDITINDTIQLMNSFNSEDDFIKAYGNDLTYSYQTTCGNSIIMKEGIVEFDNRYDYLRLMLQCRLNELDKQIFHIKRGLTKIIPETLINMMTHKELETRICGKKKVDVDLLKINTKYINGLDINSNRIKWLWEILNESNEDDKLKFIKFCWAQERLPHSQDEYNRNHVKFTIKPAINKKQDLFPKADTCFFILELPEYSNKEVMKKLVLQAITIDNVTINGDDVEAINQNNRNNDEDYEEEF